MTDRGTVLVIGGTSGIGKEIARHYAEQGGPVVLTGRDADRAKAVAVDLGGDVSGLSLDLTRPEEIAERLTSVGDVAHLVLTAVDRDENTVREFDLGGATQLVTLKLVGYTEVVHTLVDRLGEESSIVVFGGLAMERPYPGSTTVTTVNGAVASMVHTLAVELAPVRVNALHPAIVGDSPYWQAKPAHVLEGFRSRTPLGRLVSVGDVVHACTFLLENRAITGTNLKIDGGWLLT